MPSLGRSTEIVKIKQVIILSGILSLTGCVLPIPHRRIHTQGCEGKVASSITKLPISGARVASALNDNTLATTDTSGRFRIAPSYGWHGAYMIGPISFSLLPYFDMGYPAEPIRISATGYHAKEFGRDSISREWLEDKNHEYYLLPVVGSRHTK